MATLPSAQSVVDFLNSQKRDSSFRGRKKLFTESGLSSRLGDFQGTGAQNTALLKFLQGQTQAPTTPTPTGTSRVYNSQNYPLPEPSRNINPAPTAFLDNPIQRQTPATNAISLAQTPSPVPNFTDISVGLAGARAQAQKIQEGINALSSAEAPVASPPVSVPDSTKIDVPQAGAKAEDYLPEESKDEADLIQQYMASPEFKLFTDRQELAGMTEEQKAEELKATLESKYEQEKTSLEQKLAVNGLAFSGIRATQVKALADSLATSELGVDRDMATKLLDANLDLRENILKGVADLIKEADSGRKEAIQQLNQMGLAVVNGTLVPTLSAQRQEDLQIQRNLQNELALAKYDLSIAKDQRSADLAYERLAIAAERLNLAEDRAAHALGEDISEEDIKAWENRIRSGFATESTVPEAIRTRVVRRVQAATDLDDDIAGSVRDGISKETAIANLTKVYKDSFSEEEIKRTVELAYPDTPEETVTGNSQGVFGFFKSFFQ